jgi:hypothetical protein
LGATEVFVLTDEEGSLFFDPVLVVGLVAAGAGLLDTAGTCGEGDGGW